MSELPFEFDRPEDSPGFLLWQTSISWQRQIKEALEPFEISHSSFVIMALLLWLDSNKIKPKQVLLANYSKLDKMTISKTLKKLSKDGLIEKSECIKDTRANKISLTQGGKHLMFRLVPIVENIDKSFYKKLDEKDMNDLIRIMQKVNGNAK